MDCGMNFGDALERLKEGDNVTRSGWNGEGMCIYLESNICGNEYEPFIVMHTAEGKYQPGWLASQADILAEDWYTEG